MLGCKQPKCFPWADLGAGALGFCGSLEGHKTSILVPRQTFPASPSSRSEQTMSQSHIPFKEQGCAKHRIFLSKRLSCYWSVLEFLACLCSLVSVLPLHVQAGLPHLERGPEWAGDVLRAKETVWVNLWGRKEGYLCVSSGIRHHWLFLR